MGVRSAVAAIAECNVINIRGAFGARHIEKFAKPLFAPTQKRANGQFSVGLFGVNLDPVPA